MIYTTILSKHSLYLCSSTLCLYTDIVQIQNQNQKPKTLFHSDKNSISTYKLYNILYNRMFTGYILFQLELIELEIEHLLK